MATDTATPPSTTHSLPSPFTFTTPPPTLLTQGAEALVYKTSFLDKTTPACLKFRPSKAYRHATLDARLTKQRVLAESRVLVKLSSIVATSIVRVPAILALEWDVGRKVKGTEGVSKLRRGQNDTAAGAWILMEWIEGKSVKELLRNVDAWKKSSERDEQQINAIDEEVKILLRKIGRSVGEMHSQGSVIHGDLTSSNIMVRPTEKPVNGHVEGEQRPNLQGEIVLIDFGLATQGVQDEDRAVDVYVLERAFGSTHPKQEDWFDAEVLQHPEGYKGSFKGANVVLKRLEDVRMRGRKRSMIG